MDKDEEKNVPNARNVYRHRRKKRWGKPKSSFPSVKFGAFESECLEFGDGYLKAKASEPGRLRAIAEAHRLAAALRLPFVLPCRRSRTGRKVAAYHRKPRQPSSRGTTASDLADVPEAKRFAVWAKGSSCPYGQRRPIQPRLYKLVTELRQKQNAWQTKTLIAGARTRRCSRSTVGVDTLCKFCTDLIFPLPLRRSLILKICPASRPSF